MIFSKLAPMGYVVFGSLAIAQLAYKLRFYKVGDKFVGWSIQAMSWDLNRQLKKRDKKDGVA